MWDWIKRSNTTDTLSLAEEKKHNRQLQKLLADSLHDSQALNQKLTDALDRVLVSKFDPPLMPQPREQANNISFPDVSDVLSIEDDAKFIETMEQLTK